MSALAYKNEQIQGINQLPLALAPEDLGVWLGPDAAAEPPIYGSNGDRLPPVAFSLARFQWFRDQLYVEENPVLQKHMVESTVVSEISGCWLPSQSRYRAHGGYVPQGDTKSGVNESGSTSRHRSVWQRIHVPKGEEPLTKEKTGEHICRTTGCSNDEHQIIMPIDENNERKNAARGLEDNLRANQPSWVLTGVEWLEPFINESGEGLVDIVICTRYGAYLLEVDEGAIIGHSLLDPVREAMRSPAPYPRHKEKAEVHKNQLSLDSLEMYADLLRRAIAKRKLVHEPLLAA